MFTPIRTKKGPPASSQKNLTAVEAVQDILSHEKRTLLLAQIQNACALDHAKYESCVINLIKNLTKHCQLLPESENNYYSQPGGILDYALNRTDAALSLFKQFVVIEPGEAWSEEQKLWQYALLSASLLQGIGKLYLDFTVHLYDKHKKYLDLWAPLSNALTEHASHYAYAFTGHQDLTFRHRLNLVMARILMPADGFSFIASSPDVFAVWLSLLDEDYYNAGTLGAILIRADALALQRYFNDIAIDRAQRRRSALGRVGAFGGGSPEVEYDPEKTGTELIKWIRQELEHGRLVLNKPPLFIVPQGLLILPELFMMFLKHYPTFKNWLLIQKGLLSLGLHREGQTDDPNYNFQQSGKAKNQTGIVLDHFATILPEQVQVYDKKSGQSQTLSAINLIVQLDDLCHLAEQLEMKKPSSPMILTANGKWVVNAIPVVETTLQLSDSIRG